MLTILVNMTADDVRKLLRKEIEEAGSLREWARKHKIDPGYVSCVVTGKKEPHDAICTALGLRREVLYRVRR